jgi:hypothetical protein
MSDEKFKVYKSHKLMDWIENEVTEWALNQVTEHFGDDVENLTQEQIEEVIEEMDNFDDWTYTGLRNIVGIWENENDEYLI